MTRGTAGFGVDVADLYNRYRHGYPDAVVQGILTTFAVESDDVIVDLGCGTGQLARPLARHVRSVVGIDPEAAMLERAARAADDAGQDNLVWVLAAARDLAAVRRLLPVHSVAVVTVGQALHWMDRAALLEEVRMLARPGGGLAIVTNGRPLWQQGTEWSRRLRSFLETWLQTELRDPCGTDQGSHDRYQDELAAAGYAVTTRAVEYAVELPFDDLVGGLLSAMGTALPLGDDRARFVEGLRARLPDQDRYLEEVRVTTIAGRLPPSASARPGQVGDVGSSPSRGRRRSAR